MKKRGFTLIELLAVIVIIAIIALIAIPVILNIIESAKKASAIDSAYGYVKGVENYLLQKELRNEEKELIIGENDVEEVTKLISVKGNKPVSGIIEINNRNVVTKGVNLCISGYSVQYEIGKEAYISGKCKEEEKEIVIEDKKACELETEIKDGKEYYYIDSESDLYELSKEVNNGNNFSGKIVKLRNDLDMSNVKNKCGEEEFEPIGTSSTPFSGTFEGNAKTISNLTINKPEQDNVGLFGYSNGTIKGITLENIKIKGNNNVGGLAGYSGGNVSEIMLSGNVEGDSNVGGLLGTGANSGTVTNIIVKSIEIPSGNMVGGIVAKGGTVKNSIIEKGLINGSTISGSSSSILNTYYTDLVTVNYNIQGTKYDSNAIESINGLESIVDTWIGGDDDDSGYYFDYNNKGELVIKSTEKDPITFNLKGSGTEEDPYLIGSYQEWKEATTKADLLGVVFKLTNDIDFSGKNFYMLGSYQNQFSGILDGDNYTVKKIKINGGSYLGGLVGYNNGTIKEINLKDININGDSFLGGITGYNASNVLAVNLESIIITGTNQIGGISGYNKNIIKEAILSTKTIGTENIGGVTGANSGTVTDIIVKSIEIPSGNMVGGIVAKGGTVKNSIIEKGSINGSTISGSSSSILNTYYTDLVTVNYNIQGTAYNSNALGNINGYESAIDTWIGGDDDDSGYYFDYNNKGELVIKSIEKDPITFNLKGSGTEENPYLIGSYQDWKEATTKADQVGLVFKLTSDIDFTGKNFYMLGSIQNKFSGILDGDGHKLTGIETKGGSYQGIIGYMDSSTAVVKNLKVENMNIKYITNYSGNLVGYINAGTVEGIDMNKITVEDSGDYIGGLIGYNKGIIKGINVISANISGKNQVAVISGYNEGTINEVAFAGIITGTGSVGGITGANSGTVTNIIVKSIEIPSGNMVGGIVAKGGTVKNSIIEKGSINGSTISGSSSSILNTYYTDLVTVNYNIQGTQYSSAYVNDLTYYDSLLDSNNNPIIESKYTGDVNGSGYFFDYGSDGKIKVVKAYSYNKGNASVDENYTMTKIVGTTDTTAPTCNLDYVTAVSNGIRASFSCTDESGVPEISSLFDSTTSKSAETFENIGTIKNGVVNGNTRSVVSTWTTNNSVSKPTRGTCYYFRYGARDSSGNYTTYVTDKCYTGFN